MYSRNNTSANDLIALSGGSAVAAAFLTSAPLWLLAPVLSLWGLHHRGGLSAMLRSDI
jgi:hypothetical protein